MALIVKNNISSNYIKYKGKLYQKTTSTIQNTDVAVDADKLYNSIEEGIFDSNIINSSTSQLRPVYIGINETAHTPILPNINNNSYNVDVIQKTNIHPLFGLGSSFCLSISGNQNLELNLIRGKTYYFYQTNTSNTNNKLIITLDNAGLQNANIASETYTGIPGTDGVLFFTIPLNGPQNYYLSSEGGQYMGIKINVDVYCESLPSTVANFNMLSADSYYVLL